MCISLERKDNLREAQVEHWNIENIFTCLLYV